MENVKTVPEKRKKLLIIIAVGLMAALVYVGNYLQISIPVAVGKPTRIHLGNSMCLLAGLLFGGLNGGLSSGIGAAIFDLCSPIYFASAPLTFCNKFAMGFTAGKLAKLGKTDNKGRNVAGIIIAAVVGQLVYIVLYLASSFVSLLLLGSAPAAALAGILPKLVSSSINAAAAVVIAVPLYFALTKALKHTDFYSIIEVKKTESKGYLNPVTVSLIAALCIVTLFFSMLFSSFSKIMRNQKKEIEALTERVTACEEMLGTAAPEEK